VIRTDFGWRIKTMSLSKPGGLIVLAAASFGMVYVESSRLSPLISLTLLILYFVLLGFLIERGMVPHEYWPFQRRIGLQDLAIAAACLVAALAAALILRFLGNGRAAILTTSVMMLVLIGAGGLFLAKGLFRGPCRR
jgi:hypothetical protein